jgi:hypothetical protein
MNLDMTTFGLLATIVGAAIAWGTERQARRDLGVRHAELAAELRPRLNLVEAELSTRKADHRQLEEHVRGLKEQLDRIEGIVSTAAKRKRT